MTEIMTLEPLPIDAHLARIGSEVARARAAVVVAAPGAGKTTRVPASLLEGGRVIVLQPRRVAARAIARRIAEERGWQVGAEVGWQVRFDRRFGRETRLLVVTEGILTARLQSDPLLSDFTTIVIDEFHERSVHADVALALARQAWFARADLRIVIMSATLDAAAVARFLGGCPIIDVPGRAHPVTVEYLPGERLADAAAGAARRTAGDVLCFLPGAPEIHRALPQVRAAVGDAFEVLPLHGSLNADEQDRVFEAPQRRRVVLATNIAETSITVPRITAVVDTGLHKVARYDAARALDSLDLERVGQDSADQRSGRAGRVAPGLALRLWDARDRLRARREPEIARVDLSAAVLDIMAWGGHPLSMDWFERPANGSLESAVELLERLHAAACGRLTEIGRQLQRFPLHPRLGRILVAGGAAWEAAVVCAVMSERSFVPERAATTTCDLLAAVDGFDTLPPHVRQVTNQIHRLAVRTLGAAARAHIGESDLRRAILSGYPDRVAWRRAPGEARLRLATGTGATLAAQSGVIEGEFLVALDVQAGARDRARESPVEARVRLASRVEREWLEPTGVRVEHRVEETTGTVRAVEVERYHALVLAERPARIDPDQAAALLAKAYVSGGPGDQDAQLLRRLRFAGETAEFEELARGAARKARRLADISLRAALRPDVACALDTLAPERLLLPSGRTAALDYRADGTVATSVKLQELFGLQDTPRVGARREPVLLLLLAPNGRPVQTTRDLRSFWEKTYPEVRKELRGRYPKHPWPEDPLNAAPTHRAAARQRRGHH